MRPGITCRFGVQAGNHCGRKMKGGRLVIFYKSVIWNSWCCCRESISAAFENPFCVLAEVEWHVRDVLLIFANIFFLFCAIMRFLYVNWWYLNVFAFIQKSMTWRLCLSYKCRHFWVMLSFLNDLHIFKDMCTDYFPSAVFAPVKELATRLTLWEIASSSHPWSQREKAFSTVWNMIFNLAR